MPKVPDDITLGELCKKAAQSLTKAGLQHRIDIYRDVEVDDPAVRLMLGRAHKVRIRIKITAASLLFENTADNPPERPSPTRASRSSPRWCRSRSPSSTAVEHCRPAQPGAAEVSSKRCTASGRGKGATAP